MDRKAAEETVHVQLHSSIHHPGQEKETHTFQAIGRYTEKSNSAYLQYEEELDGQKIQTIVKLGNEEALIMRSGAIKMRLPLSKVEERFGEYQNGPVTFKLQVKTTELDIIQEEERNGKFQAAYELYAEGSILGTYELSITYSEGKQ